MIAIMDGIRENWRRCFWPIVGLLFGSTAGVTTFSPHEGCGYDTKKYGEVELAVDLDVASDEWREFS